VTSELALAITLAAHGNVVLAGDTAARRVLTPEHHALSSLASLAFTRGTETVATTPVAWFDHLRGRGARRLVLTWLSRRTEWLPAHHAVAAAGGCGVMLAADTRPAPELWAGEWRPRFSALHREEGRVVWDVVYHAAEPAVPVRADEAPAARYELERAHERLRAALQAMIAVDRHSDRATGFFTPALALLASTEVLVPARGLDLLPATGYGPAARRLLAAATLAGSVPGPGHDEAGEPRQRLGEALVAEAQAATLAAVNAFGAER